MDLEKENKKQLWFDEDSSQILEALCNEKEVPVDIVQKLISLQKENQYKDRAYGINDRIEEILTGFD